jgi:Xaa-Pro aminopeptidase
VNHPDRIAAMRALSDALLITHGPHVTWATGFTGSNGWLLVTASESVLLTDGRYSEQAARQAPHVEVLITSDPLAQALAPRVRGLAGLSVQDTHLTVAQARAVGEGAPGLALTPLGDAVERLVAVKTREQVDAIVRAQRVAEEVFEEVVRGIRTGQREHEVAARLTYGCLARGASRMAFEPIVASGPNSALPHARPTDRQLQPDEPLLIDFGCVLGGYASDMTRMLHLSGPSDGFRRAHAAVLEAQRAAIGAARAELLAASLDAAARDVLGRHGFADRFVHGLGHGIGLETHEWPRVTHQVDYALPEGAVVTIEPGVYLPGEWGIRIEDMVWLGSEGCTNLTQTPAELRVI